MIMPGFALFNLNNCDTMPFNTLYNLPNFPNQQMKGGESYFIKW